MVQTRADDTSTINDVQEGFGSKSVDYYDVDGS